MHTFKEAFAHNWTPGIGYTVPYGETMVAAAPGVVIKVEELHTGRAGGFMVKVDHGKVELRDNGTYVPAFRSYYAHLDSVVKSVEQGKPVNRGDPIGKVTSYHEIAKLMFVDGLYSNFVDPDNWGFKHTYMKYQSDHPSEELEDVNSNLIKERQQKQDTILKQMYDLIQDGSIKYPHWHPRSIHGKVRWDLVEEVRYLEKLYNLNHVHHLFPTASKEQFESLRKDFYDNQPIILTFPFEKR